MPTLNPTTFTITDTAVTAEGVTGFNVKFGRASGVYTLTAAVPQADLATEATGTITGKLSDLNTQLAAGDWFAVATAVNIAGEGGPSPEVTFTITPPVPSPPSGFTVGG